MPIFANINSPIFLILEKKNLCCLLCSNSEKFKEKVKVTPILPLRNTQEHSMTYITARFFLTQPLEKWK